MRRHDVLVALPLPSTEERKLRVFAVIRVVSILGTLILWALITETGLIKTLFLPSPSEVIRSALAIGDALPGHLAATFLRTIVSFILGTGLGIGIGLAMAYSPYIAAVVDPLIESARPVPPVAVVPFFILWFGFSDLGKILLVLLGTMVVMAVYTFEAIHRVRPIYVRAALSFGASRMELFRGVVSRAILPDLIPGLRVAMALAITLVIVSEFMGARSGVGHLINVAKATSNTPLIMFCAFALGLMSLLFDWGIRLVMGNLTQWSERFEDAVTFRQANLQGGTYV